MAARTDVLVVGTLYPTVGGIASAIEDQVQALRGRGLRVEVLNTGRRRRRRPGSVSFENGAEAALDAARVFGSAVRLRPRLVAVHTVASPVLPAVRALTLVGAARAAGAPVITHIHAYDLRESLTSGSSRYAAVLARLARWSARVVVLHDGVAADIRGVAPDASVVIVPNCVDCERYRPVDITEGTARVVFVGTAGRRKGAVVLVEALARVRHPIVCDIAGGPAEEEQEAYDDLRRAGASLVASGRLEFHGEVDRERSLALLQRASLFVLPSFAEGMPVALLEAMACGVAAIVTDVGAMGDIVREAGCGLVVSPGDVDALADAIDSLLGDDRRRSLMGAAGRKAILERHCCDAVGDTLAALYRAVSR